MLMKRQCKSESGHRNGDRVTSACSHLFILNCHFCLFMHETRKNLYIPRGIGTCRSFDDNRNETNRKFYYIYFIFNVNFKCIYFVGCCCCTTMTTTATVYRANKNKKIYQFNLKFFFRNEWTMNGCHIYKTVNANKQTNWQKERKKKID